MSKKEEFAKVVAISVDLKSIAEEVRTKLRQAAGQDVAFVLVTSLSGTAQYISNAARDDGMRLLTAVLHSWEDSDMTFVASRSEADPKPDPEPDPERAREIAAFVRERDAALIALDLEWARRMILTHEQRDRNNVSDLALLCSMHRARYNIVTIPEAQRHESATWLRQRGLTDMCGMPLLPPGQLPAATL